MSLIAPTLQGFFTERLVRQRQASPATIASYRDSLRLLLRFAVDHTAKNPSALDFDDLDADTITAFLTHLETDRGNTARTRNNRLAAIRALFSYAALQHPEHAETIARVLAIPQKRHALSDRECALLVGISAKGAAPRGGAESGGPSNLVPPGCRFRC